MRYPLRVIIEASFITFKSFSALLYCCDQESKFCLELTSRQSIKFGIRVEKVYLVNFSDGCREYIWFKTTHTSFEESSRAKKFYITFDTDFWRYLPSRSRIGGSLKWSIAKFCSERKFAGEIR